jgi:tRNA C32,U32 (ribose-2'-O)-methylase TrmJ
LWYLGLAAGTSARPRTHSWEGAESAREVAAGSGRRSKETKVALVFGWRRGYGRVGETAAAAEVAAAAMVVVVPAGEDGSV